MGANNYSDLNDMHIDVLKEIGNIGAGNAATALSTMLAQKVDMSVPKVKILDFNEIAQMLGGPETQVVGILIDLSQDVNGMIMFILEQKFAHIILNLLMGRQFTTFEELNEMDLSAIQEIGNILASSYVNSISELTGLDIFVSTPSISIDMAGAILSVPAIQFAELGDKVLFIEESFLGDAENIASHMILIPEMDSLKLILERLGITLWVNSQ